MKWRVSVLWSLPAVGVFPEDRIAQGKFAVAEEFAKLIVTNPPVKDATAMCVAIKPLSAGPVFAQEWSHFYGPAYKAATKRFRKHGKMKKT